MLLTAHRVLSEFDECGALVASLSHSVNSLIDIEGIQVAFCDSLELITGRVTELNV